MLPVDIHRFVVIWAPCGGVISHRRAQDAHPQRVRRSVDPRVIARPGAYFGWDGRRLGGLEVQVGDLVESIADQQMITTHREEIGGMVDGDACAYATNGEAGTGGRANIDPLESP